VEFEGCELSVGAVEVCDLEAEEPGVVEAVLSGDGDPEGAHPTVPVVGGGEVEGDPGAAVSVGGDLGLGFDSEVEGGVSGGHPYSPEADQVEVLEASSGESDVDCLVRRSEQHDQ